MTEQPPSTTGQPYATPEVSQQWEAFGRLLRRRLWTILTFLTITVLVVAATTWTQVPIYRATATVFIDMETPNVLAVSSMGEQSVLGQANYLTYADYYRTQLEVLKSKALAEQVFANLKLSENAVYATSPSPISTLLSQVTVEPIRQTRLAKIHVVDQSPQQAARIANEFALALGEENLARAIATETLTLMKNKYIRLQYREADLAQRYKAKHPAMLRLRQEMEQLTQASEQEINRQLHSGQQQATGGDSAVASKPLIDRVKESSMLGSLRPNNIRVQDLAHAPSKPLKPNKPLNLILALLLGLIGGLGIAVTQELLDNSVKTPEDIEQDHRLVLLGYVPKINGLRQAHSLDKSQTRQQPVQLDPGSMGAEAYRTLRTSLLYATPRGNSHAVVVTSPGTSEGKTTTVSHLGMTLAQSNLKVLLVDADMRRGRLHNVFQLKRTPGLSEFLTGQASLEEVIKPTGVAGLSVVASGAFPPNPAELLGSNRMREFLAQATKLFDRVLLDSPPVTAVTDAVILAAMTETVVAIAQSGKTPRQALYRLVSRCQEVRAKVLGVVLNNTPAREAPTYYRYAAYRYAPPTKSTRKSRRPAS